MTAEHILLVTPAFHGYYRSIADGFRQLDYTVTSYCYDLYSSATSKLRNKMMLELPQRVGISTHDARSRWDTQRAVQALRSARPDRVLVIKGDSLGEDFWSELDSMGVPVTLWLYDDLERHRYSFDFLSRLQPVLTYASSEAERLKDAGIDARYVPNAFDPQLAQLPTRWRHELVFVGAKYPNRTDILERLVRDGFPVRAYGRQWSRHPYDRLRTWELRRPKIPGERDIPLAEAYRIQGGGAGAINIHGLQAGLSMRTFEIPGMGGVQFIDRPDVAEFYDPGTEVLVYDSYDELRELAQRALTDVDWTRSIRQRARERSLAHHTFRHRAELVAGMWRHG